MKLKSLLFTFILLPVFLFGQEDTENSKTYNITYSTFSSKKEKVEYTRLLKINPILFLVGDMPIYFEQKLTDVFALELGVGVTYFDYLGSTYSLFEENYDLFDYDIYPKFGYSFRTNIKYYPSFILDEWYFGAGYQYKKYFAELRNIDSGDWYTEEKTISDIRIMVGYVYYFSDQVFADLYGTMGFRNKTIGLTGSPATKYQMPNIGFGIKIGFTL